MSASYEFWLLDDKGARITLLKGYSFFSYSRSIRGLGVLEIGFPFEVIKQQVFPIFRPDRRIEVWRSPGVGIPLRREQVYLLRKYRMYTRKSDSVKIVMFYGRDPKDLLNRRFIIQAAGTSYTRKENTPVDDMMKAIVREQMLYGYAVDADGVLSTERAWPNGEFLVQEDYSLGPSLTQNFPEKNVLDTLKSLQDASFQKALESINNRRIYFDVVSAELISTVSYILDEEDPSLPILDEDGFPLLDEESSEVSERNAGFRFETFADLRGQDRTDGTIFCIENGNIQEPDYNLNHLEENTSVIVKGFGRGDSRAWAKVDAENVTASRWNRIEIFEDASSEPDQTNLEDFGYEPLYKNRAIEELNVVFLNNPGNQDTPRSLYGVNWDLGDLLPVDYADKRWAVEVFIVYVSQDENGIETISGRNDVNASNQ